MRIDFSDENIKPIAGDVALLAYAYYIKFGATEAEETAVFRLGEFLNSRLGEVYADKAVRLAAKLDGILSEYHEFAAAVLENFG